MITHLLKQTFCFYSAAQHLGYFNRILSLSQLHHDHSKKRNVVVTRGLHTAKILGYNDHNCMVTAASGFIEKNFILQRASTDTCLLAKL